MHGTCVSIESDQINACVHVTVRHYSCVCYIIAAVIIIITYDIVKKL